jgi:glutathione-specific gamma-glutamylcyclotransferase
VSRTLWVFGYGSLVWRPGMAVIEGHPGWVTGWTRRFWQGSPDHRGTPSAPGRVVTLVPEAGARCYGQVWRVAPDVLAALDHREQAGYSRHVQPARLADGTSVDALLYVAEPDNPSWLGPATLAEMAAHIQRSHGPSGPNREYLLRLADVLSTQGVQDAHVAALASAVRALPQDPDHLVADAPAGTEGQVEVLPQAGPNRG